MRRSRVGSSFTATRDEYIKLEFKRRANHPGLRRRSSITDQFAVRAPTSRLKERLAQARHHEFILQTENRAALDSIVDRVRELSDYHTGVAQSLSPMERNKLLAWANDVEKIMYEFEPSDDHHMDPFVAVLEKLQFLQDGHICLVEVAVEGRRLLERWERSGVFDSDSSGSSGSDDEDRIDDRRTPYERNTERLIEQSFGYMSIRARAAARVIKRNIVRWARAKENFRERVEELQLFGSTTQTLMKQLTGGSPSARRAGNDVFDLVKVRREAMLSQTILFKDLMQFSKHVALYPIDQALRCVEELELKRFLFETRCAMKLQMFWRKVQKELPVRRMMKLIDTVKRRDRKSSDVSVAGTPKTRRSSNKRDSASLASDIPPSPIMPLPTTLETPASAKARTPADSRETDSRGAIAPGLVTRQKAEQQVRKSRGSRYPSGASGATKAATPQSSQTAVPVPTPPSSGSRSFKGRTPNALLPVETEIRRDSATSDDDTRDVEAAWKTFLETAATVAETEAAEAARKGSDPGLHAIDEEASPTAVVSSTAEAAAGETLDQDSGDWLTWSDDEKVEGGSDSDEERNDDGNRHLLSPHVKFPKHHQSRRSSYTPPSAGGFAMNAPMTPMRVIVNVRAGQRQTDDTSNSAADGSAFDPRNALSSRELREILNSIEAHAQQSLTDAAAAPKTPPTAPRQGTASTTASATMSNSAVTTPERTSRLRAQPSRQSFVLPFDEVKRPEQTSVPTTPSDMGKTPRRPLHELSSTEVDSGFHLLELLDPLVVASSLALLEEPPMTVKPTRPAVLVDPTRVKVTTLRADQLRQRINESRKRQDDTAAAKSSHVRQSAASAALAANYKAQPLVYAIPKMDMRREALVRRAGGTPVEPAVSVMATTAPVGANTTVLMPKSKFGSHSDYMQSIGLSDGVIKPKTAKKPQHYKVVGLKKAKVVDKPKRQRHGSQLMTRPQSRGGVLPRFPPTMRDKITALLQVDDSAVLKQDSSAKLLLPAVTDVALVDDPVLARQASRRPRKNQLTNEELLRRQKTITTIRQDEQTKQGDGESEDDDASVTTGSTSVGDSVANVDEAEDSHSDRDSITEDASSVHTDDSKASFSEGENDDAVKDDNEAEGDTKTRRQHHKHHKHDRRRGRARTRTTPRPSAPTNGSVQDTETTEDATDQCKSSVDKKQERRTEDKDTRSGSVEEEGKTPAVAVSSIAVRRTRKDDRRVVPTVKTKVRRAPEATLGSSSLHAPPPNEREEHVSRSTATTRPQSRQEREAMFQKLMMQYLGLLNCAPATTLMPNGHAPHTVTTTKQQTDRTSLRLD